MQRKNAHLENIKYIIKDSTLLEGIKIKDFLSHIETKSDLTTYFAEHAINALKESGKRIGVVYQTKGVSNIENYPQELLQHNHEEADTLLILQPKLVCDMNPFCEVYISSPDTDVFILLIHFYPHLCPATTFWTGKAPNIRDIDICKIYESLGPKHADAILAFHTFTGCDQTVRFYGKSETEFYKTFKNANIECLTPFINLGQDISMPSDDTVKEQICS